MSKLAEALREISVSRVFENEAMSKHTTFRVGGPAEVLFYPASYSDIVRALEIAQNFDVPVTLIGNGSNLLVRDGGIPGLTLAIGEHFSDIRVEGKSIHAQAGATLAQLAAAAQRHGLSGLEFASGIPGSLGGGCAMNAGAYGGQLSDVLTSARVLMDGEIRVLSHDEMEMGYRSTLVLRKGAIVLAADFALREDDPETIRERMRELNARRRDKQPLNLPSAGSFFKRPEGHFAGALIEGSGLKGARIGGAQVSEKHAGFLVNVGDATAGDVLRLMEHVQRSVYERTGVMLEPEVRILGVD